MSDDGPKLTVSTDHCRITVRDTRTAKLALELIDGVLTHYIGETAHVARGTDGSKTPRQAHEPVDVECDKCGYQWTYRGRNAKRSTCPNCKKNAQFNPDLVERGVR